MRILSDGTVFVKNINMNGESGYTRVNFDSGRKAMTLTQAGLRFWLDDAANGNFLDFVRAASGLFLHMYSCPGFVINDALHNKNIATFDRQDDQGNPPAIRLWQRTTYFGGTTSGYEIATKNDICDERVKKNISESKQSALDKIDKIEFKEFDWDEEKIDRNGHIDIGIIAQQVKEIDNNYIDMTFIDNGNNDIKKLYSINVLNMLTTTMKAVQELNQKIREQEETITKLQKKIDKLEKGE